MANIAWYVPLFRVEGHERVVHDVRHDDCEAPAAFCVAHVCIAAQFGLQTNSRKCSLAHRRAPQCLFNLPCFVRYGLPELATARPACGRSIRSVTGYLRVALGLAGKSQRARNFFLLLKEEVPP